MRTTQKSRLRTLFLASVLFAALLAGGGRAGANGAPVTIYLSYLPEVSNWGPKDASGIAVVAVGDGEVSLEVSGLPRLENEHYQAWLESRAERTLYPVGKFNADVDGMARLNVLLDTLPYQEYRMLLITVEEDPDPSTEPSERRSLAGFFPNLAIVHLTDNTPGSTTSSPLLPGSSTQATGTAGLSRPDYLPTTGSAAPALPITLSITLVAISLIMLAAGSLIKVKTEEEGP